MPEFKDGKLKKTILLALFILLISVAFLMGCENQDLAGSANDSYGDGNSAMKMIVNVNGTDFCATLADNSAAHAFANMIGDSSLSLNLRDYGGFEKVGSLGCNLPASNRQITTYPGDIVLYQGNQIVMFYGSNSWSYTMLARINDLAGWKEALGSGDVSAVFSMEK